MSKLDDLLTKLDRDVKAVAVAPTRLDKARYGYWLGQNKIIFRKSIRASWQAWFPDSPVWFECDTPDTFYLKDVCDIRDIAAIEDLPTHRYRYASEFIGNPGNWNMLLKESGG